MPEKKEKKGRKVRKALLMLAVLIGSQVLAKPQQAIDAWHQPVQKGIPDLKVGDKVPDFKISKIFNGSKKNASLSEFRDRLVIFDFGNTRCGGCVAALPRMDKLERTFGDRIRIFWVTYEPEATVEKFWKTSKLARNNQLQTIVEDSTVTAYFRHESWPHEAWVYKGQVIAITDPEYVDSNNIQKVLDGEPVNWPVKDDFAKFDDSSPMLMPDPRQVGNGVGNRNLALQYTAITAYNELAGPSKAGFIRIQRDSLQKTVRACLLNWPVFNAYFYLLNNAEGYGGRIIPGLLTPNQVSWQVKDRNNYRHEKGKGYYQDWLRIHGFCFESLRKDMGQSDKEIYKSILSDMDRIMGLHVRWERQKEKVLVLVRTRVAGKNGSPDKLQSRHTITDPEEERISHNGSHYQFRDVTLGSLASLLNDQAQNPYVFDETHYTGPVDLDLDILSWTDISAVRNAILAYGLDLREEEKEVDKLVFTENGRAFIQ